MSAASGAQHPPAGDVITGTAIRNWWMIVGGVLGATLTVGGSCAMTNARIEQVERKVGAVEVLDRRLRKLDRKIDLILCAADKTKCAAAIPIADDDSP